MLKKLLLAAISTLVLSAPAAMAQQALVPNGSVGQSIGGTVAGALSSLLLTAPSSTGAMRNGLPATTTDSFVYQSGYSENIYGDEGVYSIPPFFEFTKEHRINQGIFGQRDAGLTTGHGSVLPDAAGGDEFVKGPEFAMSGSTMQQGMPAGIFAPIVGAVGNAVNNGLQNAGVPVGVGLGGSSGF